MNTDEWLHVAKLLPTGHKMRVRHGRESRENLLISNQPDRWTAWCFACNEGGVVLKEHVTMQAPLPREAERYLQRYSTDPEDLILAKCDPELWERITRFLLSKGTDPVYLPTLYIQKDKALRDRFFLQDNFMQWHSRVLGHQPKGAPKWLRHGSVPVSGHAGTVTILCEDLFSMYRLQHAMQDVPCTYVLCTLGCRLNDFAMTLMLNSGTQEIVWAYDGDSAGRHGIEVGSKRARPHGYSQSIMEIPNGKDPKDLHKHELMNLFHNRKSLNRT